MSLKSLIVLGNILLTTVVAAPVSHGRLFNLPLSTSGQRQTHLLPSQSNGHAQALLNQDPHASGSHQNHDNAEKWADSLIVDPTDEQHYREISPARSPIHQHAIIPPEHQASGHELSQNQAEKLKELERFLDLDEDHEAAIHPSPGTTTSSLHIPSRGGTLAPAAPTRDLLEQSSGIISTNLPPAATHTSQPGTGSNTKSRKASKDPVRNLPLRRYRPFWGKDFDPGVKNKIRRALDKMATAKWGTPTSKRRHMLVKSLTHDQIAHLGKGQPPESLPLDNSLATHILAAPPVNPKRPIDSAITRRKGPWTNGLTLTQIEIIHDFGDEVMARRGARSVSLKNALLGSLSHQELLDVADEKQEERRVIMEKLVPAKKKPGPRPRTEAK